MTFKDATQEERVIRLLRNDAKLREYHRNHAKEYRARKKELTGVGQKQYYSRETINRVRREYYYRFTAIDHIRYLFKTTK